MAVRVNVRFVTILCVVVGVVFVGMAGAAYFIVKKSAADHFAAAEASIQAGNYVEAQQSLSKAVNKEPTNIVYLEQWIETIEKLTPETRVQYEDMYWKNYVPGVRQLAVAKRTDVDAWNSYLNAEYERRSAFGVTGRSGWQSMLTETNSALEYFLATTEADDDDAQWHRLRRYRALSNLNILQSTGEADPDFGEKTVLDFEAALRVDPSDAESAIGLYDWFMIAADRARGGRTDPQVYLEQARDVLDGFLADNPRHPQAMLARLLYDARVSLRPVRQLRTQQEKIRATVAVAETYAPQLEVMVDRVLRESPPELIDVAVAQLVLPLERLTRGDTATPLNDRVLEAARRNSQGNPSALVLINFYEGYISSQSGQDERAIAAFERVMESPQVPVSLAGMMMSGTRGQAALRRVQSAIDLANRAEGEEKATARKRVTEFRKAIDAYFQPGSLPIKLLDARIAYLNGELAEAQRLAVAYQREGGAEDPEASFLLSTIYMDRKQVGQAVTELEKLVELSPNNALAWARLSVLQERIGDQENARKSIERAAELAPENTNIQDRYQFSQETSGQRVSEDPIRQTMIQVQRLLETTGGTAPRYDQAIALLRQAMARHGDDERFFNAIATIQGMQSKLDESLQTIDQGLAKFPDSTILQQLRTQILLSTSADTAEETIRSKLDGVREQLELYRSFNRFGRTSEAEAALAEAIRLAPDEPEVILIQFGRALDADNYAEAQRLVERATALNTDQAGGRILRASLLHKQGRSPEALALINSVVTDGLTSVPVLLRRAQILRGMGRIDDAVSDYEEMLRRQPDSIENIREVIGALAGLERYRKALEIARRSQRVAGADPVFLNLWLALEAEVGDSTAAMLRREDIRQSDPTNRQNNLALANVYVKLGEWTKARALIDDLRAQQDDLQLVLLDARWHADQGELGRGVATVEQYLNTRQAAGEIDARDVLSYASFLQSQGQSGRAIAVLQASRELDTADARPLGRRLALLLLAAGRADEAVAVIDDLIASGNDTDGMLGLARVEAYIRGGELEKAQQAIDAVDADSKASEAAGILRTDIALGRGNRAAALKALSDTLASHPTSARAYVKRAEVIWSGVQQETGYSDAERTQFTRDAGEDLKEAIRHDPNIWEAYRLQGIMAMAAGQYDQAATAIAKLIELNPGQAILRDRLIRTLVEANNTPRAMIVIDRAIQASPANVGLRVDMARLMADLRRPAEAIRLFESALSQQRNPEIAAQFVEYLLGQNTSDTRAKARQVLADPNLNVAGTWQLQLMAAGLSLTEGNRARAVAQARQSFEMVRKDTSGVIRWFNALPSLIKDHPTRMEIALQLGAENTPQRVGEVMLASLMLTDPSTEPQGLSELRRLASDTDPVVASRAGQLLGDTLYAQENYAAAVEAWQGVIQRQPDASQSLNNLAYVLATQMGQCEQAVEFAKRAIEVGGVAPTIARSTLAVALINCGMFDEARRVVDELSTLARGTPDEVLAIIRRGEIDLGRGNPEPARARLEEAKLLIESWGGRADAYRSVVEDFEAAVGGR